MEEDDDNYEKKKTEQEELGKNYLILNAHSTTWAIHIYIYKFHFFFYHKQNSKSIFITLFMIQVTLCLKRIVEKLSRMSREGSYDLGRHSSRYGAKKAKLAGPEQFLP